MERYCYEVIRWSEVASAHGYEIGATFGNPRVRDTEPIRVRVFDDDGEMVCEAMLHDPCGQASGFELVEALGPSLGATHVKMFQGAWCSL